MKYAIICVWFLFYECCIIDIIVERMIMMFSTMWAIGTQSMTLLASLTVELAPVAIALNGDKRQRDMSHIAPVL